MSTNGKTVLLVEDNEDNRIVYSTILRHFGYTVTEALNGEEGIVKARTEKPDLILMDISIPVIDGWEATQVLKHVRGRRPGSARRSGERRGGRARHRASVHMALRWRQNVAARSQTARR